jgi:hypothetical protein
VDTVIDKQDVLEDLANIPDWYKKILLPLLDIIKQDVVAKSIKIMDRVDYVFYVNGALGSIHILKEYIVNWIKWFDKEKVSDLTRKPISKKYIYNWK